LWLCIWFWWRRVIVRVLKITKMTLKTVLNEGKSSILHRVVKSARFDPHHARFCPQLCLLHPLSPNAPRWSAASRFVVFGHSAPRLAAIDNRGVSYQTLLSHFNSFIYVIQGEQCIHLLVHTTKRNFNTDRCTAPFLCVSFRNM